MTDYMANNTNSGMNETTNTNDGYHALNESHYNDDDYYYYGGYGDYEYFDIHLYHIFEFEIAIYGYLWPALVLITASCNVLVITGFLRRRMRNATNILLVSIAVSDTLTGLVTLPATIHVFSRNHFALSKIWCEATMLTRLFISRAFHTSSVWQTLLLAIYRYFQLRDPVRAQRWITMGKSIVFIAVIYVMSFVLHIYHAFDKKTIYGMCHWILEEPCVRTCIYIWCALLFGHLIPCLVLIFLTIGIVRRLRMIKINPQSEMEFKTRKKAEQFRTLTKTVIAIVIIFLVPELPYGFFYLLTVSLGHSEKAILPLKVNRLVHCLYEILQVLSFHLNFWVYCLLIRHFRSCIKRFIQLITCRVVSFKSLDERTTTTSSEAVELRAITTETDEIQATTSDNFLD